MKRNRVPRVETVGAVRQKRFLPLRQSAIDDMHGKGVLPVGSEQAQHRGRQAVEVIPIGRERDVNHRARSDGKG